MRGSTTGRPTRYAFTSRLLHWAMAILVIAQLFLGVAMVASLDAYHLLRTVHQPLGFAILVLAVVRIGNRIVHRPPPLPTGMRPAERMVATGSEYLLYGLLVLQPVTGWAMLSAGGFPIVLTAQLSLPAIAPRDPDLYSVLRQSHTVLGYLLFAAFTAHLCAVLFHTFVLRDRILGRMTMGRRPRPAEQPQRQDQEFRVS
ncbi:cytochrome b [Rhodococcus sp. NPDC057014]|uniref:cytochrome b n=1 Tax=Rhodococcus sp. NPDC057014 TaxID=3346000 RepID=UPI00363EA2E9